MTARSEGFEHLALPEMERRIANTVRMGTVAEIDYAKRRVKIQSGDILTGWIPWNAGRASSKKRRWDPPTKDEQVTMISPSGDLRQAVVLPGIYQDAADAPVDSGDKDHTTYGDGTVVEYDQASHTLVADLGDSKITASKTEIVLERGGTKMTMTAAGTFFDGPVTFNDGVTGGAGMTLTGELHVTGPSVTHNSVNIGSTHVHGGVQSGGSNSSVPH